MFNSHRRTLREKEYFITVQWMVLFMRFHCMFVRVTDLPPDDGYTYKDRYPCVVSFYYRKIDIIITKISY